MVIGFGSLYWSMRKMRSHMGGIRYALDGISGNLANVEMRLDYSGQLVRVPSMILAKNIGN